MNELIFWEIIEQSKNDSDSIFTNNVAERLSKLEAKDIYEFQIILNKKVSEIYTWDAFGCHLIFEVVGDYLAFLDFSHFIISRGKNFFERFSNEGAESVAEELLMLERKDVSFRFESFTNVCSDALAIISTESFINPRDYAYNQGYPTNPSSEFKGEVLYEKEMPKRFPKLWKYREMLKVKYGF